MQAANALSVLPQREGAPGSTDSYSIISGSTSSDRGDVIRELDLMLGAVLDGLEANGQLQTMQGAYLQLIAAP